MIRSCSCGRYKVAIDVYPRGTPGVLDCPTCKTSPYFREDILVDAITEQLQGLMTDAAVPEPIQTSLGLDAITALHFYLEAAGDLPLSKANPRAFLAGFIAGRRPF